MCNETRLTIIGDIRNVIPATRELQGEIIGGKGYAESYFIFKEEFVRFAKKHNVTVEVSDFYQGGACRDVVFSPTAEDFVEV